MSDSYTRVYEDRPGGGFAIERSAPESAPFKVVPSDAIVIERESLHPVIDDGRFLTVKTEFVTAPSVNIAGQRLAPSGNTLWEDAIARISLAVHLEEHPPVDQAEVDRIADALSASMYQHESGQLDRRETARRMYLNGVRASSGAA